MEEKFEKAQQEGENGAAPKGFSAHFWTFVLILVGIALFLTLLVFCSGFLPQDDGRLLNLIYLLMVLIVLIVPSYLR
ncbi:hypothetical protein FAI40_03265 [Acetobacteraceae bacterium]|nr:hypothetical protein FAI40_03265 [Acetobacteraceae bacterium]